MKQKTKKVAGLPEVEQVDLNIKKATLKEKEQLIVSQRFKDRSESKKGIMEKLNSLRFILSDFTMESDPNRPLSESFLVKKLIENEDDRQVIKDKIMDLIKKL